MPLELQPSCCGSAAKEVTPVGSSIPTQIDIQIIAATNRGADVEVGGKADSAKTCFIG